MHRPQLVTWTTHTAETTTLLDYRKLYTYMCNIVTEFYLYSIVYIYLINSRLDVTFSVRHHFRIETLSNLTLSPGDPRPTLCFVYSLFRLKHLVIYFTNLILTKIVPVLFSVSINIEGTGKPRC